MRHFPRLGNRREENLTKVMKKQNLKMKIVSFKTKVQNWTKMDQNCTFRDLTEDQKT